jgi:hypothetical protein
LISGGKKHSTNGGVITAPLGGRYKLAGLTIGLLSYWSFVLYWILTSDSDISSAYLPWMGILVTFTEGIVSSYDKKIRVIGLAGWGVLLGWLSELVVSLAVPNFSPWSHNLLIFEPVYLFIWIVGGTLIGSLAGTIFLSRLINRKNSAASPKFYDRLFVLALALSIASPLGMTLVGFITGKSEQFWAKRTIVSLTESQFDYARDNPSEGFTCEMARLTLRRVGQRKFSDNEFSYQAAIIGAYNFRLWCYPERLPRNRFLLEAYPTSSKSTGNVVFCSDESGLVRYFKQGNLATRLASCRESGVLVINMLR